MDTTNARNQAKNQAKRQAGKANEHPAVKMLARGGFVVMGILHILIGWIAIQIATGIPTSTAIPTDTPVTISRSIASDQ